MEDIARLHQRALDETGAVVAGITRDQGDTASRLSQLADLKSQGVLTDAESESQKSKILALS